MDRLGIILRTVVFFLFPIPFLLSFAQAHGADWTGYVAYIAVIVLVAAATVMGWAVSRRERE
jgi:hypothetical protein